MWLLACFLSLRKKERQMLCVHNSKSWRHRRSWAPANLSPSQEKQASCSGAVWPIFCDNSWGWKLCSGATDCIHAQWVCLHAKQKYWCISHGPGSFGALGPRWCDANKLWISLIIVLNLRWPVWKLVANNYFKKSFRKTNSELWVK